MTRDLRDIVNVSRLSYVDSDDEDSTRYSLHSSVDFEQSSYFNNDHTPKLHTKYPATTKPVIYALNNSNFKPSINKKQPLFSSTAPIHSTHSLTSSSIFGQSESRSSFFKDPSLLLDRTSKPNANQLSSPSQISLNIKKPLPPLKTQKSEYGGIPMPLSDSNLPSHSKESKENVVNEADDDSTTKGGNFDRMLTYIDASVVSEWLNRANRSLRKLHHWHQSNRNLYDRPKNTGDSIKYESFVNFANFWLGCNKISKLDHKQRRQLLEMEYSIICDEVTQAFQIGIDSQQIGLADIHRLLHAVFKEYPLQLLSFRGVYMLLDYIDTLSSNRQNEYKHLLSDVKCRTVNKQYAQWLLSIRSFSLINLCWSIVKFYKKTACHEQPNKPIMPLDELNDRISVLSMHNPNDLKCRSISTSSSHSSNSVDSTHTPRPQSTNQFVGSRSEVEFLQVSNQEKYDCYLKSVLKNDYPEVLHYLITTKKCDPHVIDDQGRTLVFLAVINDLPKILNYLVKRWTSIDINQACHSGNTPLHAAVNQGNLVLVELLLKSLSNDGVINTEDSSRSSFVSSSVFEARQTFKLDVNRTNSKCMDMSPLHLAVWNDFTEIAIRLVQSDADPNLKMNGNTSVFDVAIDNKNQVLYELLGDYYNGSDKSMGNEF